ncbi:helix-turn-helix domain-containing protein [Salinispora cortesiana]|uniref:helix-turn-helix domain-containing protein n=1 Tax=Salinispora cortesiana TaxID=1305843 RepID=UPI00040D7EDF|nr:helix-turn-helix domain-containing protein [Salinispora cortesiana]
MDKQQSRHVTQVEVLKAFTHPLRLRLYYALATTTSATATQLAKRVDTTAQLAFYHLTRLADLGVVEEDPCAEAHGRERYWRQSSRGLTFDPNSFDKDTEREVEVLHRAQAAVHAELLRQFFDTPADPSDTLRAAAFGTDMILELTAAELDELREEITAVLLRFRDRPRASDPNAPTPPVSRVFALAHAFSMK